MYPVSQHFSDMMKSINRQIGLKIVIDGVEYGNDKIVDLTVEYSLSASEKLTIGTIVASKLNFSIREFEANIAENATVEPYIRFEGGLMWNEAVNEWNIEEATWNFDETEWMPLGKYYVDNRTFTEQRLWKFECYDATVLLHQNYISALTYPQTMRSVLQEVCSQVGIQIANIELINENYQVSLLPTEITLHKVISYIASANCCSAFIDRDGKLKFIKLSSEMYNTPACTITRRDYFKAKRTNDKVVIDTIKLYEKDGFTEGEFSELVRGTGSPHTTLNLVNPFMDEDILDDVYNTLNGFEYIPYELDYKCFPNLEIGDVVTIEQSVGSSWLETTETWGNADFTWDYDIISFNVIVLYNKITYKGGLRSTLKADSESQQTSEFKVKGSLRQYVENIDKNTIKEGKVYNGVTTSREEGIVVERSDGKAKTIMNATEGISIYSDIGSGLAKNFFVGLDGRIQAKGLDIDGASTFNGVIKANQILIGGDNGYISFHDLSDKPNYLKETYIDQTSIQSPNIYGGTIQGVVIIGSTMIAGESSQIRLSNNDSHFGAIEFLAANYIQASIYYKNTLSELCIDASGRQITLDASHIFMDSGVLINGNVAIENGSLSVNGWPIATQSWVIGNFSPNGHTHNYAPISHDHGNDYVKSYTGQNLSLVATETGIVVRVNGVTLGSIFYD